MASDVRFVWHGETFARELGAALGPALGDAAEVYLSRIKSSMKGGMRGVPSPPGSPPHTRTRRLQGSVKIHDATGTGARVQVDVSAGGPSQESSVFGQRAPYAAYLEQGTSKMAARPFMGPAVADSKLHRTAQERFSKRLVRALMRSTLPNG